MRRVIAAVIAAAALALPAQPAAALACQVYDLRAAFWRHVDAPDTYLLVYGGFSDMHDPRHDKAADTVTWQATFTGMARAVALENGPHGITCNCIGPGWIKTGSSSSREVAAGKRTPAGRAGTPDEVAHAALFLASYDASYITGQLIVVDGGNTLQELKGG